MVDREQRVREIVEATLAILGEQGYKELTLRNLAQRMGGSITLITHYFANRDLLLSGVLEVVLDDARKFSEQLMSIEDPHDRLRAVMLWFLPLSEVEVRNERGRISLVAHQDASPAIRDWLDEMEVAMRSVLAKAVSDFVEPDERDAIVDQMRVWGSGMVLSVAEHPEIWTPERQLEALERFLNALRLTANIRPTPGAARARAGRTAAPATDE
ncbi:TetR/AcrR family transcriptional regulator [Streptomyces sp. NPDC048288]|uniref:TetR/AcrR family transcriptional regulator n=1 Tax=Streptomyces sp. NPDC048288 TaxID=3365529 RepID=UPI003719F389